MAECLRGSQPARSRTIFSLLMKKAAVFEKASHSLLGKSAGTLSGSWCSRLQGENLMCKLFQPLRALNGSHRGFWSAVGSFLGADFPDFCWSPRSPRGVQPLQEWAVLQDAGRIQRSPRRRALNATLKRAFVCSVLCCLLHSSDFCSSFPQGFHVEQQSVRLVVNPGFSYLRSVCARYGDGARPLRFAAPVKPEQNCENLLFFVMYLLCREWTL